MKVISQSISRMCRFAVLTSVVLMLAAQNAAAGYLSDNLKAELVGKGPDDPVKVWIVLPEVESASALKATARTSATTRAERYRLTFDRLREGHIAAQRDLLDHLNTLRQSKQNLSMPPRGHWLVNIVEAELTVRQLDEIVSRPDIEAIYSVPQIVSVTPDDYTFGLDETPMAESNLAYINAPAAWAAGYTGQGRVICIFDTGIDGLHPAIFDAWKGHDGDSAAAWFDPSTGGTFPHVLPVTASAVPWHGTATTGLTLGHDDSTGDTTGVALDARWIAAGVVDVEGAAIIDAFEWAADPDGDPNSLDDVPDVINHSWGVRDVGCENIFYTMIDNIEALGIVNIFAAGNEGSQGSMTIRNPANRANDWLDCFAVGNIDHNTGNIAFSSSRGPSDCDPTKFKPNVVAPGVGVRVPLSGNLYATASGTSFATPHVSGLVALLRQKNPNATVDEIKEAILTSTNDLNRSLPDNTYGWGLIDCMAALNALPATNPEPNVRVYSFDHDPISPGDQVVGTLVLTNLGASVTGVTATLIDNNEAVSIQTGTSAFGTIDEGQIVSAQTDFQLTVSETVNTGSVLSIGLNISGTNYSKTTTLYIVVGPAPTRAGLTHRTGTLEFTVSNYGTYGLADDSYFPAGGDGFRFMGGDNDIFEAGLLIGTGVEQVSDGVHNGMTEPDGDFAVAPGGDIRFVPPDDGVSEQSYSAFTDARAEVPMGVSVEQHTYAFEYDPYRDFVILQYIIRNTSSTYLSNLYVGMFCDWDIVEYASNAGGFDFLGQFSWVALHDGARLSDYRGIKVLHGQLVTVYTDLTSQISCPDNCYLNSSKMSSLRKGVSSPPGLADGYNDLFQVMAVSTTLAPGEVDTVSFAVIAAETFSQFQDNADAALEAYIDTLLDGKAQIPPPLLEDFVLYQNYPNPFNDGTVIAFSLTRTVDYTLGIYNILGQKVRQFSALGGPGIVRIPVSSSGLASGLYFYRLNAGDFVKSKKMLLLK